MNGKNPSVIIRPFQTADTRGSNNTRVRKEFPHSKIGTMIRTAVFSNDFPLPEFLLFVFYKFYLPMMNELVFGSERNTDRTETGNCIRLFLERMEISQLQYLMNI